MIRLDVEPYCHDCDKFSPETNCTKFYNDSKVAEVHTMVFCEYRKACSKMMEYLESKKN